MSHETAQGVGVDLFCFITHAHTPKPPKVKFSFTHHFVKRICVLHHSLKLNLAGSLDEGKEKNSRESSKVKKTSTAVKISKAQ